MSDTQALLFYAIEQAARPDEFSGQDAQCENNGHYARAGGNDHYYA